MIYRFEVDGKIRKFDTNAATLLMSNRWTRGKDQTWWSELYCTPKGDYVRVFCSPWVVERYWVTPVGKPEALAILALAEPRQRTPEGEQFLSENDGCDDI